MGFLRAVRMFRWPETEVPDLPVAGVVFGRPPFLLIFLYSAFVVAAFCFGWSRSRLPVRMTALEVEIRCRGSRYVEACDCPDLIFRKHAPRLSVGRGADPKPAGASRSPSAGNKSWEIIGSGNRIRFLKKRRPDNIVRTPFDTVGEAVIPFSEPLRCRRCGIRSVRRAL